MQENVPPSRPQAVTWGYLAAFTALVATGVVTFWAAQGQVQLDRWVSHTHEVIARLEEVQSAVANAESGQRGFVITGKPEYLEGFAQDVRTARAALDDVARLTADNPTQQRRLPSLRANLEAKVAEMERPIEARRAGSPERAAARVASGVGRHLMGEIHAHVGAMQTEENRLLGLRRAAAVRAARTFRVSLASGTLAGLLLLSGLYASARRLIREQSDRRRDEAAHRAQLEGRVDERTAELKAVNDNLESFSYSVSHDLRGPLRNIGLQAALLEDDLPGITPDQQAAIERIRRNVKRMSSLMDDLLKLSRSTRGELRRTSVDLSALAHRTLDEVAQRHPREDVTIAVADGLVAQADAPMAAILFDNLLRNAWKYSKNTPNAVVEVGREGDAFFVRDNGAGFDEARFAEALEPFSRLHTDKEFEGSGIGLAICNRIVARHGGRLWARSKPGQGATILFTLS